MAVFFLYGLYFADLHEKLLLLHSSRMNCFMKSVNLICACTQPLAADMMLSGKKKNNPGEMLLCLWIFSAVNVLNFYCLCHIYEIHSSQILGSDMRGIHSETGTYNCPYLGVSVPFCMGISKVPVSLLYLSFIFLADSLKQGMSWNISSSARFQLCLSHLGLSNFCSLKVRPALKVCWFKVMQFWKKDKTSLSFLTQVSQAEHELTQPCQS